MILTLTIALFLFIALIWFKNSVSPPTETEQNKTFVITQGQGLSEISKNLKKEGLIKNALAFRILAAVRRVSNKIQAGSFQLSAKMPAHKILESLTFGTFDVWVTIPEGWRVEEIADELHSKLGINQAEFIRVAKEGYMFPDTYLIPKKAQATEAAKIMRDNFNRKIDETLKKQISARGLTLDQAIILSSIIEREVKFDEDRSIVAGVLLKRWKQGLALGADSTVQYAAGFQTLEKSWWKKILLDADLEINSPFNTRKFVGLPPTPICNPGLASIKAVVAPTETEFLYYLSDEEGKMHYAKTLPEHIENIKNYL